MKQNLVPRLGALLALGAVAVFVLAQSISPNATVSKLDSAIALLALDKPQEAKELLATIEPGDPSYEAAKRYSALCLYELKDYLGFLKAVESFEISAPVVPPEIQEELAFERIAARFYYRKFEDIFPKIQAFRTAHPASVRLDAVTEYQMAALLERGMKKLYEAALHKEGERYRARREEGHTNLVEFLNLARERSGGGYKALPQRNLEEDLWGARLALGDEEALFAEVPSSDVARRERLSLVRLRVYQKLYSNQVDRLLELMGGFVGEFPNSTTRTRVEYEMADLSFEVAERAWLELRESGNVGAAQAQAKWDLIRRYNASGREVAARLLRQKGSGLEPQDYLHLCQDYLNSYHEERDFEKLASEVGVLLGDYEEGSLGWVMGRIYEGVVLACQTPPRSAEAGRLFEQVMSLGFRNKPSFDQWITCAAKWRVYLALADGNKAEAETVAAWVETGNCSKELKRDFGKKYHLLVETAN